MIGQLRQILGLCFIIGCVLIVMYLATALSLARLKDAETESQRLEQQEAALLARLDTLRQIETNQKTMPPEYIWPGLERPEWEIAFQKALVTSVDKAGLRMVSFGPGQPPEDITSPAEGYDIEVEGGHEELARLLLQIETNRPRFSYSYLWIRQLSGGVGDDGKALLSARIGVWGFVNTPIEAVAP